MVIDARVRHYKDYDATEEEGDPDKFHVGDEESIG